MPNIWTKCTACDGTGHGDEHCRRNRYFGCEECDGLGEVKTEIEIAEAEALRVSEAA